MLKQRVITAIVLLAVLLPALFYKTPSPFCAIAIVLISAGAWEWGRLNAVSQTASVGLALIFMMVCFCCWYVGALNKPMPLLWAGAGIFWVLGGGWLLRIGVIAWPTIPRVLRVVVGLVVLWMAWLAVAQARFIGTQFLLSMLLLVWVADIFAYFAGRAFGGQFSKTKLAPSISPGKSWEGVWGGMLGVVILSLIWGGYGYSNQPTLFSHLVSRHGILVMLLAVIFLGAMSVVGDLVESLVKRSAGVKDSSGLLPGHGGILDRIDALLPTIPLAMMLASI